MQSQAGEEAFGKPGIEPRWTHSNKSGVGTAYSASSLTRGMSHFGAFEGILLKSEQLRNVSERVETLADEHADVDELISVAGNIRNIAAVLDVFTVIRSRAGGADDSVLLPPANGLLN
jgi:hypothetical protein